MVSTQRRWVPALITLGMALTPTVYAQNEGNEPNPPEGAGPTTAAPAPPEGTVAKGSAVTHLPTNCDTTVYIDVDKVASADPVQNNRDRIQTRAELLSKQYPQIAAATRV